MSLSERLRSLSERTQRTLDSTERRMKDLGIAPARSSDEWVMLRGSHGDAGASPHAGRLDDLLAARSTPAELAAQGVLKAPLGVSSVLAGPAHDLQSKLMRRYSIPEAEKSRILKAPIGQAAESLERQMNADALSRGLTRRATAEDLTSRGILKAPVGSAASKLEQRMRADALNSALTHRSSMEDLQAAARPTASPPPPPPPPPPQTTPRAERNR